MDSTNTTNRLMCQFDKESSKNKVLKQIVYYLKNNIDDYINEDIKYLEKSNKKIEKDIITFNKKLVKAQGESDSNDTFINSDSSNSWTLKEIHKVTQNYYTHNMSFEQLSILHKRPVKSIIKLLVQRKFGRRSYIYLRRYNNISYEQFYKILGKNHSNPFDALDYIDNINYNTPPSPPFLRLPKATIY